MTFGKGVVFFYAVCMLIIGISAAGSSPISFYAAAGIGVIAMILFIISLRTQKPRWIYIVTMVLALIGSGRFISKLVSEGNTTLYPNMTVLAISALTILGLLAGHLMAKGKSDSK